MEHFSTVKFAMGYEKDRSFFVKYQNLQKFESKVEKNPTGPLKSDWHTMCILQRNINSF